VTSTVEIEEEGAMAKILVVDDKRAHRRFICDTLRLEDYEVVEASNGKEALGLLEREDVDLVTLDQEMPGMTGLELYERMTKDQDLPVVFVTVHGDDPRFVELRREHIPVLVKPLDYRDILKAVESALQ
jgi:CheY-like chemotaxis protein